MIINALGSERMKFIQIADVHLGATPDVGYGWSEDRRREIIESFKNVLHICNEEAVDLLLIAGDLFHKQPLVRDLKEVNYLFEQLKTTKVVLIAGNHDYISRHSNYHNFKWNSNVTMLMSPIMESIYFEELNTEVYGFSYHERDILEPRIDNISPKRLDRINILLAHGGDERNVPINKNKLKESTFDYIALGHIHKPEIIHHHIAYSGSLEPIDKNEIGERGYILGNIEKGKCSIQFIPNSIRQYYHLEIISDKSTTNEALLDASAKKIKEKGSNHIYKLILTGIRAEEIHFDRNRFMQLGNVIEVVDQTVPDYDFNELYEENKNNLIGMYIDHICNSGEEDEIIRKALYYGIEALLNTKG